MLTFPPSSKSSCSAPGTGSLSSPWGYGSSEMFAAMRRTLSTSHCDLHILFSVSCSREERRFGAGGRGGLEVAVPEGEGRGGGLSRGAGAGVLNSGGDGDSSAGGGISFVVWPFGGFACKSSVWNRPKCLRRPCPLHLGG